ncbi:hypothetical protein, partial [Sansalvadorimonas verongulae]|uniref:hypothetical protein n=1 Tax=Sansalvadorimonas verongulae TaxID=2172824 RepID=UPI0012BB7F9F
MQLKARALFQLDDFDRCIEYINSFPENVQNNKGVMMAKARALQAKGHLTEALPLFQSLYTNYSAHPHDEKNHGLALGRHLQLIGGADNLRAGLNIYTQLRTRAAGGIADTPCGDKDIELTLGRHLQVMGGAGNLRKALHIYTQLRTRAAGGRENTPCDDKEIELALGRSFQLLRGPENLRAALAIYTRLRTR